MEINADGMGRDASALIDKIRLPNMYVPTQVKFVRQNGKKVAKH